MNTLNLNQDSNSQILRTVSNSTSCPFCIPPVTPIYEDQQFYVIKDINPTDAFHALIIPKVHVENYENTFLLSRAFNLAKMLVKLYDLPSYSITLWSPLSKCISRSPSFKKQQVYRMTNPIRYVQVEESIRESLKSTFKLKETGNYALGR